jgi:hypothetical protein
MPLAGTNPVNHIPAILSRMSLAEANHVNHANQANLVNTLDFIYIEHDIYYNCIHPKDFKLYKCK